MSIATLFPDGDDNGGSLPWKARADKLGQRSDAHRAMSAHRAKRSKAMRLKASGASMAQRKIK